MGQCAASAVGSRSPKYGHRNLVSLGGRKVGGCITTTTSTPFIPLRAVRAVAKLCGLCAQSTHLSAARVKCGLQRRANPRRFWKCLRLAPLPDWRSAVTQNRKAVSGTRMSWERRFGNQVPPQRRGPSLRIVISSQPIPIGRHSNSALARFPL